MNNLANKILNDGKALIQSKNGFAIPAKNNALINCLEQELEKTRENLQLTMKKLGTSNKTLQSVNEELHTIKKKHQEKIQELADLNADMDNFLGSTKTGTIFLDKNLCIRSFTQAIKDQFNLLPSDMGRSISNFANTFGNLNIAEDVCLVLATDAQIEKEVRSGNEWYLMRLLPFKKGVGKIEGIVINFVNITRLVSVEKALAASEKFFDSFVEHSPLLTWIKNERGEYIYVNRAFEENFKISRKILIGKTHEVLYPQNKSEEIYRKIKRMLEKWETDSCQETIQRDNETFVYRTVRFPFIVLDDQRYIGGISRDVTEHVRAKEELQRSESMLKAAQGLAHMGSWQIDLTCNRHEWSDEFYKIFGLKQNTDITPSLSSFLSFIHPDDLAFVTGEIEKTKSTFADASFNFRFIRNDEEIRYGYSEWKTDFNDKHKPLRLYGILMDITERKKAEEERAKMMDDIIQRNQNLEQFSYVVSHNLRSPVANILGICTALQPDLLGTEEQQDIIKSLSCSVKKLDEIVIDLNTILNLKSGINEKKEKISFSRIAKNVFKDIKPLAEQKQAEIIWDFSAADEIITLKSYLQSIFYNLLSNSLKYHQPDLPPVIEVKSQKKGDAIELFFKDNGLGIDLDKRRDQVFGLYKRFHTDKAEGKGMGLYLVKTQVEAMDGKISIISGVNKGTEFKIEFRNK